MSLEYSIKGVETFKSFNPIPFSLLLKIDILLHMNL